MAWSLGASCSSLAWLHHLCCTCPQQPLCNNEIDTVVFVKSAKCGIVCRNLFLVLPVQQYAFTLCIQCQQFGLSSACACAAVLEALLHRGCKHSNTCCHCRYFKPALSCSECCVVVPVCFCQDTVGSCCACWYSACFVCAAMMLSRGAVAYM